jgi:hypothetical protein
LQRYFRDKRRAASSDPDVKESTVIEMADQQSAADYYNAEQAKVPGTWQSKEPPAPAPKAIRKTAGGKPKPGMLRMAAGEFPVDEAIEGRIATERSWQPPPSRNNEWKYIEARKAMQPGGNRSQAGGFVPEGYNDPAVIALINKHAKSKEDGEAIARATDYYGASDATARSAILKKKGNP